MTHRLLLIAAACLSLACSPLLAEDWPRFRGPRGDGIVGAASVPLAWAPDRNIIWKTALPGPGSSSPVISGNRVFLTSYSGYGQDPANPGQLAALKRHALCFDLATGKLLWSHAIPAPSPETAYEGRYVTQHGYASATPVTDGRNVYFFLAKSGVLATTVEGKKLWHVSVGDGHHDWGSGASPILYRDLLIVNAAMESDSLLALDKRTGRTVWTATGFPRAWNTPLVVNVNGRDELVVNANGLLRAFDPATGRELWRCQAIRAAELCPSVVVGDGVIFVVGSPKGETMAVRAGGSGDVTDTHVLWRIPRGSNVVSPVYHDGHLYFASDSRGVFYCLKADTGQVVYEQRLPARGDRIYASPILIDNRLLYVTRTSGAYILPASPRFEILAHNRLDDPGPFNASPAVAANRLLLRSDGFLYCIGAR